MPLSTETARGRRAVRLGEFPWDRLAAAAAVARRHPDGIVDLSVGTPVDPVPALARAAMSGNTDTPGYPATAGNGRWQAAARAWLQRRCHAPEQVGVLPTIGSKELVAWLPTLLGVRGPVQVPELAYPTYAVGAQLAGCPVVTGGAAALVWLNSPANPTGEVLGADALRRAVDGARGGGAVVASDECYLDFGWDAEPVSVLDPVVNGGDLTGVLVLHSLSKRSNLAGYRAGLVAGDPELIAELLELRRHTGMIMPEPVQAAAAACLADEAHVAVQRERYARRRTRLAEALRVAGFRLGASAGGLYLWATREESCWDSVATLAEAGVLVAPGEFYGAAGNRHVRVALTATDERVTAAVERLANLPA